jgi:hypothetical protein
MQQLPWRTKKKASSWENPLKNTIVSLHAMHESAASSQQRLSQSNIIRRQSGLPTQELEQFQLS